MEEVDDDGNDTTVEAGVVGGVGSTEDGVVGTVGTKDVITSVGVCVERLAVASGVSEVANKDVTASVGTGVKGEPIASGVSGTGTLLRLDML